MLNWGRREPFHAATVSGAESAKRTCGGQDRNFVAEAAGAEFLGSDAAGEEQTEGQYGKREEGGSCVEGVAAYLDYAVDGNDAGVKGVGGLDGGDDE